MLLITIYSVASSFTLLAYVSADWTMLAASLIHVRPAQSLANNDQPSTCGGLLPCIHVIEAVRKTRLLSRVSINLQYVRYERDRHRDVSLSITSKDSVSK